MKKTLLILVALIFVVTSCEKSTYIDGTYKVSYDAPHYGYTAFVEFTMTSDVVSDLDFDYINDAGDMMKSEDTAYANNMFPVAGTSPDIYLPILEDQLMEAVIVPEFEEIDGVSGATGSTAAANHLFSAALENALAGEPADEAIPEPAE